MVVMNIRNRAHSKNATFWILELEHIQKILIFEFEYSNQYLNSNIDAGRAGHASFAGFGYGGLR